MPFTRSILVSAFLATLLIGCKKAETPTAPTPTVSDSVAAPVSSLPMSDGKLSPAPSSVTSSSGNSSGPTQASSKELTKFEESTQMPLPGQVNNHSTVDPLEKK